jgi:hypothetical protein
MPRRFATSLEYAGIGDADLLAYVARCRMMPIQS